MEMSKFKRILQLILCLIALSAVANGLRFEVNSRGSKCISEDLLGDVVVLANYSVISYIEGRPGISVQVTSPYGNSLHQVENVPSGQFGFTSKESGAHMACFWITNPPLHQEVTYTIDLDWKVGVATKDWESVARKEKVEGVEFELMRVESSIQAIHENLVHLRTREAEMRSVSEKTNARVAWLSIFALGVTLTCSVIQILSLKQFFQKKRLI